MSRLRGNPGKRTCETWMGVDKSGNDLGICGEPAVIRCNACKQYFCEECWPDHLRMTVVIWEVKKWGELLLREGYSPECE